MMSNSVNRYVRQRKYLVYLSTKKDANLSNTTIPYLFFLSPDITEMLVMSHVNANDVGELQDNAIPDQAK